MTAPEERVVRASWLRTPAFSWMMHQGTEARGGRAELVQKCHAQAEKLEATGHIVRTLGETVTGMVEATEVINAQNADEVPALDNRWPQLHTCFISWNAVQA